MNKNKNTILRFFKPSGTSATQTTSQRTAPTVPTRVEADRELPSLSTSTGASKTAATTKKRKTRSRRWVYDKHDVLLTDAKKYVLSNANYFEYRQHHIRTKVRCKVCFSVADELMKSRSLKQRNLKISMAGWNYFSNVRLLEHAFASETHKLALTLQKSKSEQREWRRLISQCKDIRNNECASDDGVDEETIAWRGWCRLVEKDKAWAAVMLARVTSVAADCVSLTSSGNSWPTRMMAHSISKSIPMSTIRSDFKPYKPKPLDVDHLYPADHAEYRSAIREYLSFSLRDALLKAKSITPIMDGELDNLQTYNYWTMARYSTARGELKHVFLGGEKGDGCGAAAGVSALKSAFGSTVSFNKIKHIIHSISYDGTSVNTGASGGIGALLSDELRRKIIKSVCECHSGSLAFKEMFTSKKGIADLERFEQHLLAIKKIFRAKNRVESLEALCLKSGRKARRFPTYSRVRMAPHLLNLLEATIYNIDYIVEDLAKSQHDAKVDRETKTAVKSRIRELLKERMIKLTGLAYDFTLIYVKICEAQQSMTYSFDASAALLSDFIKRCDILKSGPIKYGMEIHLRGKVSNGLFNEKYKVTEERKRRSRTSPSYENLRTNIINLFVDKVRVRLKPPSISDNLRILLPAEWSVAWCDPDMSDDKFVRSYGKKQLTKIGAEWEMDAGLLIEGFKILKHWAIAKAGKDVVKRMKFVHFVRFLGEAIQSQSISMRPESHIFELYCRALALSPTSMPIERFISSANRLKAESRNFSRGGANDILYVNLNMPPLSMVDFRLYVGWWYISRERRSRGVNRDMQAYKRQKMMKGVFAEAIDADKEARLRYASRGKRAKIIDSLDNAKYFNNEELPNSQSDSDDDEEWLPECDEDDDEWHIDEQLAMKDFSADDKEDDGDNGSANEEGDEHAHS